MSAQHYLKCPCRHCGEAIEFPAEGIGLAVACPHCQSKTTLFAPPRPPENDDPAESPGQDSPTPRIPSPHVAADAGVYSSVRDPEQPAEDAPVPNSRRSTQVLRWCLLSIVVAGSAVGAFFWFGKHPSPSSGGMLEAPPEARKATAPDSAMSNLVSSDPQSSAAPKSVEDLKVGAVTLEKARGSSLIHAVGTLKNDSPHQRFGVRLELELTDATGNKVGVAKDYRSVLEPLQEWHFRALVLDPKTVTAKVASIREDE